ERFEFMLKEKNKALEKEQTIRSRITDRIEQVREEGVFEQKLNEMVVESERIKRELKGAEERKAGAVEIELLKEMEKSCEEVEKLRYSQLEVFEKKKLEKESEEYSRSKRGGIASLLLKKAELESAFEKAKRERNTKKIDELQDKLADTTLKIDKWREDNRTRAWEIARVEAKTRSEKKETLEEKLGGAKKRLEETYFGLKDAVQRALAGVEVMLRHEYVQLAELKLAQIEETMKNAKKTFRKKILGFGSSLLGVASLAGGAALFIAGQITAGIALGVVAVPLLIYGIGKIRERGERELFDEREDVVILNLKMNRLSADDIAYITELKKNRRWSDVGRIDTLKTGKKLNFTLAPERIMKMSEDYRAKKITEDRMLRGMLEYYANETACARKGKYVYFFKTWE
ncbi:MAG: hypothetical protein ABIH99_03805, partial [Candidatus Micrarchaeota archaeon]